MIFGCDAEVEFQPDQVPFTGCGLRGCKTENIQYDNLEMQLEAAFFKLLQQQGLKLIRHLHALDNVTFTIGWSRLLADWKSDLSSIVPMLAACFASCV